MSGYPEGAANHPYAPYNEVEHEPMTSIEDAESDICDDLELLAQVVEADRERFKSILGALVNASAARSQGSARLPNACSILRCATDMFDAIVRDEAKRIVEEKEQRADGGMTEEEMRAWAREYLARVGYDLTDTDEEKRADESQA